MARSSTSGGPGRPKGALNKSTAILKDMILGALNDVGGQEYLAWAAKAEPKAFMSLLGRVLPYQLSGAPLPQPVDVKMILVDPQKEDA